MNLSAASAGGGSGAEGARGRLQVRQKVQRVQHKQSVDKVNMENGDEYSFAFKGYELEMNIQTLLKGLNILMGCIYFDVSAVWMGLKIYYFIEHN